MASVINTLLWAYRATFWADCLVAFWAFLRRAICFKARITTIIWHKLQVISGQFYIVLYSSKTIQFKQRHVILSWPCIANHPLSSTTAAKEMLSLSPPQQGA
jgi:hypothetical protein